jgi:hypothetical protein
VLNAADAGSLTIKTRLQPVKRVEDLKEKVVLAHVELNL